MRAWSCFDHFDEFSFIKIKYRKFKLLEKLDIATILLEMKENS